LPERTLNALYDAAMAFRVRNGTYRAILADTEEEITDQVASRDLKHLTELGLLLPHGTARGRFYTAAPQLAEIRRAIVEGRDPRDNSDPFADAA
jgi:hypothetical protein